MERTCTLESNSFHGGFPFSEWIWLEEVVSLEKLAENVLKVFIPLNPWCFPPANLPTASLSRLSKARSGFCCSFERTSASSTWNQIINAMNRDGPYDFFSSKDSDQHVHLFNLVILHQMCGIFRLHRCLICLIRVWCMAKDLFYKIHMK